MRCTVRYRLFVKRQCREGACVCRSSYYALSWRTFWVQLDGVQKLLKQPRSAFISGMHQLPSAFLAVILHFIPGWTVFWDHDETEVVLSLPCRVTSGNYKTSQAQCFIKTLTFTGKGRNKAKLKIRVFLTVPMITYYALMMPQLVYQWLGFRVIPIL